VSGTAVCGREGGLQLAACTRHHRRSRKTRRHRTFSRITPDPTPSLFRPHLFSLFPPFNHSSNQFFHSLPSERAAFCQYVALTPSSNQFPARGRRETSGPLSRPIPDTYRSLLFFFLCLSSAALPHKIFVIITAVIRSKFLPRLVLLVLRTRSAVPRRSFWKREGKSAHHPGKTSTPTHVHGWPNRVSNIFRYPSDHARRIPLSFTTSRKRPPAALYPISIIVIA
jgi:hypothetical protein